MIPKILHFVYGLAEDFGGKPFTFFHWAAIRSAMRANPGWRVMFWYAHLPDTPYFADLADEMELMQIDAPDEIFGRPLFHVAHKADVVRLQVLIEHGGVYMDVDTLTVRSFDDLIDNRFVMGIETAGGKKVGLCNAIMMSEPRSLFALGWLKSYEAFRSRGRDEYWSEHSVQVPALLAERFPNEITILPQTAFFDPDWTREGLKKMFYGVSDFPEARAFHLWEAVAWNVLVHFNEKNILHLDNTYAHAVKRIIGEDVERLAAKRDAWVAEGFAQTVAKVNLGCGAKRHPEFVNCDLYPEGGPDLVFDLVEGDWPIPTSSVELVWVHHVLEHVAGDVKTFFQELHRITKDGAITEIRVPHPRHDWFLMDPTHVRAWHADSFAFLDKETCFEWLFSGDSKSPLALYWNVDFVVEHVENRVADQAIRRHLAEAFGPGLVLEKAANHLNNVVGEIVVRLRTRKG